jgi:hydrogenase nickel incorporation protein HypB
MAVKLVTIKEDILKDNKEMSALLKARFAKSKTLVVNLMSSPGAGKTSTILRTIEKLGGAVKTAVIEGDITSTVDADKMDAKGIPVVQINTGGACHIDSAMVAEAVADFDTTGIDLVVVENVGNLVCPAEFDLGEHDKVMLLSTAEGHDKPRKYPVMFHIARAMLLNKIDLLPHLDSFDIERAERDARALNLDLEIFRLSARTGEGMDAWYAWLESRIARVRGKPV